MTTLSASPVGSDLVELLAVPYRATAAYRRLLNLGHDAVPAVRAGLRHGSCDVRFHCCRYLDQYLTPDTLSDLIAMLDDREPRVRVTTLHTLACDRCKKGVCRPRETDVLPRAIDMLAEDPSAHVRAMAIEVIGRFVHRSPSAIDALDQAARSDENPTVRKKAKWYAPGGTIYQRSLPKGRPQGRRRRDGGAALTGRLDLSNSEIAASDHVRARVVPTYRPPAGRPD